MHVNIEYVSPSQILVPYIRHYLNVEVEIPGNPSEPLNHKQIIIPDGSVEMHFSYRSTTVKFGLGKSEFRTYRSAIIGMNDIENILQQTSLKHNHKCIVVKFCSNGFYQLFGIPLQEISDKIFEAEEILGNEAKNLQNQLDNAQNSRERIFFIEQLLIRQVNRYRKHSIRIDRCLKALDIINGLNGKISMQLLSDMLDISERPVQRDFQTVTGRPPKQFCRIARIHQIMKILNSSYSIDYPDLVEYFGYYDQAHLINEFKKATTITPEWYFKNKSDKIFNISNTLIFPEDLDFNNELCQNLVSNAEESYSQYLHATAINGVL